METQSRLKTECGIHAGVLDAIGRTPTVRLEKLSADLGCTLYAKLEFLNPGGSLKDRPAVNMLRAAIDSGQILPDTVVVESSSGNMGIGLAMACRYLGLRFICVVDAKTTQINQKILRAYGAELELVTKPHPQTGELLDARLDRVASLLQEHPRAFWPNQYKNPANPNSHSASTAAELFEDLDELPDALLIATSSCGTIVGFQDYLRRVNAPTRLIAVDAFGSAIFDQPLSPRLIPGLGSARPSELLLDPSSVEVALVSDRDCVAGCRLLVEREAIFAGGSAGGVVVSAIRMARSMPAHAKIAMLLPDRGERYLDTIYDNRWVAQQVCNPEEIFDDI